MEVMLITPFSGWTVNMGFRQDANLPSVGDTFIVDELYEHNGKGFYVLTINGHKAAFAPENFATLPKATASEMYEQELEAIIK